MVNRSLSVLLAFALCAGCGEQSAPSPIDVLPATAVAMNQVEQSLDDALADSDFLLFRSWNGRWIRTDCDTEIELHPGGRAVLLEYGNALRKYEGAFSASETAELTLSLDNYRGSWPSMSVFLDGSDLLLVPSDAATFVFGNRSGSTIPHDAGTFWPFRQVALTNRYDD